MPVFIKKDDDRQEDETEEYTEERIFPPTETIKEILSVEDLLQEIEATLAGCRIKLKPNGEKVWEKIGKPRLNEIGRQEIMQIMRSRLSKIYKISILDESFIRLETFLFNIQLIHILSKKCKDWELDPVHFRELINWLVSAFEAIARMSLHGNTLRMAFGHTAIEEQRKGFFGFLR